MDSTARAKKGKRQKVGTPAKRKKNLEVFTADMRFIVTRNKRNAWMDEMYESVSGQFDPPVFN